MPYNSIITRDDAAALIPEEAAREIIQKVPEQSTFLRLAHKLPDMSRNQLRMSVLSALPMAYFVTRSSSAAPAKKQTTELAWENKYIYAEEIACIVPIGQDVLDDADYDIWAESKPLIAEAFGKVIDLAAFFGTDKPTNWPTDIVAGAQSVGNSVVLGAAGVDLYDDLLSETGVYSLVEADGYFVTGNVAAISMRGKLRGLRDDNKQPLFKASMQAATQYELDGQPIEFPRNGGWDPASALLVAGAFDEAVYAFRQDMTYRLLTEGVIQDSAGTIIYNLAQQDMVALRCVMRLGWQLPNPINRIQETEASRYPFGVLLPAAS